MQVEVDVGVPNLEPPLQLPARQRRQLSIGELDGARHIEVEPSRVQHDLGRLRFAAPEVEHVPLAGGPHALFTVGSPHSEVAQGRQPINPRWVGFHLELVVEPRRPEDLHPLPRQHPGQSPGHERIEAHPESDGVAAGRFSQEAGESRDGEQTEGVRLVAVDREALTKGLHGCLVPRASPSRSARAKTARPM